MITLFIKKNIHELKLHISENQLVDKNKTHFKENVLQEACGFKKKLKHRKKNLLGNFFTK